MSNNTKKRLSRKKNQYLLRLKFESLTPEQLNTAQTISDVTVLLGRKKNDATARRFIVNLINEGKLIEEPSVGFVGPTLARKYSFPPSDKRYTQSLFNTKFRIPQKEESKRSQIHDHSPQKVFEALTEEQLSNVHTRKEMAELLGYKGKNNAKKAVSAVNNLIRRGLLKEEILGREGRGKNKHIVGNYSKIIATRVEKNIENSAQKAAEKIVEVTEKIINKVIITNGPINITFENPDSNTIEAILNKITT